MTLVEFVRPNGSRQTQHTDVVPRSDDYVELGALTSNVRSVICKYDTRDRYVVHLKEP